MTNQIKKNTTGFPSQRRHLTVLFSDICHSTRLGAITDPEIAAEIVRTVKTTAKEVVSGFGGLVTQFHGDGILAVFGYPSPSENDVHRAVEAALKLHELVDELDFEDFLPQDFKLEMHSGIEAGLVLVSDGDYLDGTLELVGDAVNTAAGICNLASDGEILVSSSTIGRDLPLFNTSTLPAMDLKGRTGKVSLVKILSRSDINTRFEASRTRGLTTFIGRENEVQTLNRYMDRAVRNSRQVVQIIGDPGLGKTRLLDEFCSHLEGKSYRIHRGHCESRGGIAPLQPFIQILRELFHLPHAEGREETLQRIRNTLSTLGENLLQYEDVFLDALTTLRTTDTPLSSHSMAVPVAQMLISQSKLTPTVLIIDDWQWVDDASRTVLYHLVRQSEKERLLIVLATRDTTASDMFLELSGRLPLLPLTKEATSQLIDELLPDKGVLDTKNNLHIKSGGNPLFLEELCQSFHDWNKKEEQSTKAGVIPATLQGLIETRVRRLPEDQINLIHIASVIGNTIPLWLLERLSGRHRSDPIFKELADSDIIYDGGIRDTLQFKHGITRETIYATVGLRLRRSLHLQIAEILEELAAVTNLDEYLESLAYHYAGAADFKRAMEFAERAGDKALASSSLDRARLQYQAALFAIEKLKPTKESKERWISISDRWALPCVYGPEKAQLDILDKTIAYAEELDDIDGLAHTQYWQGYISHVLGDQEASIDFYTKALATADKASNKRLSAQITATLGQSHAAASNYEAALGLLERAINKKKEHPNKFGIRVGTSYALSSKALILGDMGLFMESDECSENAYDNVSGNGHEIESSILNNRAVVCLWQSRWQQAIDYSIQSRQIAEQVSAPYLFACASAINAYARWMDMKDSKAIETLRQAISLVEEKGMFLYSSFFYGWISDALVDIDEDEDAHHYAKLALERADQQDRLGEAMACRTLSLVHQKRNAGAEDKVWHYIQRAMEAARIRRSPHETAITQLHKFRFLAANDPTSARVEDIEKIKAEFEAMDMTWYQQQAEMLIEHTR